MKNKRTSSFNLVRAWGVWSLLLLVLAIAIVKPFAPSLIDWLEVDTLALTTALMVSVLGVVIGEYTATYLAGDQNQQSLQRNLVLTLLAVLIFIFARNLAVAFVAWLGVSFALHRLLLYFKDRPRAVAAARKKFVVSRIGDVCILSAIVLIFYQLPSASTLDYHAIAEALRALPSDKQNLLSIQAIGWLLAAGAAIKSAQVPFHFWLPETMEAPTPVSALMHAGIINAGGYFLIRMSAIFSLFSSALVALQWVGVVTAVFGALVMITQNDIKKKLAYSTISQMGIMILCCGWGAYSLALFHIIAHSFYKAHAFLSTGTLVTEPKQEARSVNVISTERLIALIAAGALVIQLGWVVLQAQFMPQLAYAVILLVGAGPHLSFRGFLAPAAGQWRATVLLLLAIGVCFLFEALIHFGLGEAAQNTKAVSKLSLWGVYFTFVAGVWCSHWLIKNSRATYRDRNRRAEQVTVFFWNGAGFRTLTDRLILRRP
jgi:NADH:ubiquinone oxidoreductase subunit 5 (subunit L)/multisubunit Na+/H+ antiporter MnhA subunit